jgi:hypothetical protein
MIPSGPGTASGSGTSCHTALLYITSTFPAPSASSGFFNEAYLTTDSARSGSKVHVPAPAPHQFGVPPAPVSLVSVTGSLIFASVNAASGLTHRFRSAVDPAHTRQSGSRQSPGHRLLASSGHRHFGAFCLPGLHHQSAGRYALIM